jgi:hypothetical protein
MDMDVDVDVSDSLTYVFKPPFPEDRARFMAVPSNLLAETRCNVRS